MSCPAGKPGGNPPVITWALVGCGVLTILQCLLYSSALSCYSQRPSASDHSEFPTAGVLLAPQGMPVSSSFGGLPEALRCDMGMNVNAAHPPLPVRYDR